jgi:hypothetical protein
MKNEVPVDVRSLRSRHTIAHTAEEEKQVDAMIA